jgi:hypothetical protein
MRADHGRNAVSREFSIEIHRVVRMPSQHELPYNRCGRLYS